MNNSLEHSFKLTSFGEFHGVAIGGVIDESSFNSNLHESL